MHEEAADELARLQTAIQGQAVATDIDTASLTYALVGTNGRAQHGTVAMNADGRFTYTPAANYNGPDSFSFKANDGSLDSNTATVSITVKTQSTMRRWRRTEW